MKHKELEPGYYWTVQIHRMGHEQKSIAEWDGAFWTFCGSEWLLTPREFENEARRVLSDSPIEVP